MSRIQFLVCHDSLNATFTPGSCRMMTTGSLLMLISCFWPHNTQVSEKNYFRKKHGSELPFCVCEAICDHASTSCFIGVTVILIKALSLVSSLCEERIKQLFLFRSRVLVPLNNGRKTVGSCMFLLF